MTAISPPDGTAGERSPAATALAGTARRLAALDWRDAAAPYATAKVLALVVTLLSVWAASQAPGFPSGSELRTAFNQWDSQSYLHIATHGYPASTAGSDIHYDAFLPGYPLLVGLVAVALRDALVSGLLVSAALGFLALVWCGRLVSAERSVADGRFAIWLLALWPFAFFLNAVYTEGAFLACAAIALVQARHGSRLIACAAAAAACSIRVPGLALLVPLVIEQLRRHGRRLDAGWLGILAVPLPFVAFCAFLRLRTGDGLAYFHALASPSFGKRLAPPWTGLLTDVHQLTAATPAALTYVWSLEVVFGIAGLLLCAVLWFWPGLPRSYAAYSSAIWLLSTSSTLWLSVPRYELALLPGLIVAADLCRRRPALRTAMVGASAGFFAFAAGLYASGRWLG